MKNVDYTQAAPIFLEKLAHDGIFLNTPGNTMTIGWGSIGTYWGKPTVVVMVRPQRDTYHRIVEAGNFTVSVPVNADMKAQLAFAGSASGRDTDKFQGHGLTAAPAQAVSSPIVKECGLHFECVIRYSQTLTGDAMDPSVARQYPAEDYHTLFYGEIVACYRTDD